MARRFLYDRQTGKVSPLSKAVPEEQDEDQKLDKVDINNWLKVLLGDIKELEEEDDELNSDSGPSKRRSQ